MDNSMLKHYKTIGQLQTAVAQAGSLEDALHDGLKIILKASNADYAVVWYEDTKGDSVLHPYYWICPLDLTSKSHKANEGVVGRVYKKQISERLLNYAGKNRDPFSDKDFAGISIGSMVCVPLSNKYDKLGCIQFVNRKGNRKFSEEDADVCEMLSSLIAIGIDENIKLSKEAKEKKILISVRDIKKQYKNGEVITRVLKGVNLDVYEGEFLALLGESGCGKSTLLNIIGGMDKADEGEFTYLGKDMFNASQKELTKYRRDNIGFIFQSYNLMPNLNSIQNLDLIGELVENPMKSEKALQLVGLSEKEKNYPSQLSGGQQQRISIARSLIKNPKMIMADEPTAALDYETSITVLKVIEKIAKSGTTIIMVTHNEEITKMADRVIRFRDGKLYEVRVNRHPCHATDLVW